jgi:hypothetical protein
MTLIWIIEPAAAATDPRIIIKMTKSHEAGSGANPKRLKITASDQKTLKVIAERTIIIGLSNFA